METTLLIKFEGNKKCGLSIIVLKLKTISYQQHNFTKISKKLIGC